MNGFRIFFVVLTWSGLFAVLFSVNVWAKRRSIVQEQDGVSLTVKILNRCEIKQHVASISPPNNFYMSGKYQAIEFVFENRTDKDYLLYPDKMDAPVISSQKIKKKLQVNTGFVPLLIGAAVSTFLIGVIGFAYVPSVVAGFVTTVSTSAIDTDRFNDRIVHNLYNKGMDRSHPIMIESCSKTKRVMFVRKNKFKRRLVIPLCHPAGESKITFNVNLN